MFQMCFVVAAASAGVTEWLKHFLPAKVKENDKLMAGIAGLISALGSVGFKFVDHAINRADISWYSITIFAVVVVGLTQTCYNLLVQTAKAIKKKLTEKVTVDPETVADDIADKVISGVEKELTK